MNQALAIENLTVAYQQKIVLDSISMEIPQGKLVGVVGPNGAGKSTLIQAILGLVPVLSGQVHVLGGTYLEHRKKIAYVPQRESVDWDFPINVIDLVIMGFYGRLGWFKRPSRYDRNLAMQYLEQVGMSEFSHRQIRQLSGGQQQRIFLARALAQQADLYFMDEPFAGVDALTEKSIIELLHQIKETGRTVIVVHHDLSTIKSYFDWTILLNTQLISVGPTLQVFTRENLQETYSGKLTFFDHEMNSFTHSMAR